MRTTAVAFVWLHPGAMQAPLQFSSSKPSVLCLLRIVVDVSRVPIEEPVVAQPALKRPSS